MIHQMSKKLLKNEMIDTIGGPWWLIELWLQLYFHQVIGKALKDHVFPSKDFLEKQKMKTCRCTSFGEAASAIVISLDLVTFFKAFYNGLADENVIWFMKTNLNVLISLNSRQPVLMRFLHQSSSV
jgi:hypothetical protein